MRVTRNFLMQGSSIELVTLRNNHLQHEKERSRSEKSQVFSPVNS